MLTIVCTMSVLFVQGWHCKTQQMSLVTTPLSVECSYILDEVLTVCYSLLLSVIRETA